MKLRLLERLSPLKRRAKLTNAGDWMTLTLGITFPNMCVPHLPANVGGDLDNVAGSPALPSTLLS